MYVHVSLRVSVHIVAYLCMSMLVFLCILHSRELCGDLQICAIWECCELGKVTFALAGGCFIVQYSYIVMVVRGRQIFGPTY